MGVSGLLPILKPVIEDAHVRDFAGKKLAIDAFAWLHKAAFTCAYELAMGMPTDKYVHYIMQRVEMMRSLDVTPLLVFDGMSMPAKKVTNDQRSQMRSQHIARGQALAHEGNRTAATDAFQKGISIRSDMIRRTQRALREAGVEFIVAPYEADVQMAYMNREGLVDGVVTEDSDLVVYGAKRILFKMDKHGAAQLYCESSRGSIDSPSMRGFTNEDFVYMCILAGCDMLPSMPGMGIKKAAHLLSTYKKIDRVFNRIRHMDTFDMPEDYTDDFWKAFLTFRHARAYDPRTKRLDYLNQLPKHWDVDGEDGEEAIGPEISDELARGIATGEINPRTRKPYDADVQKPSRTARLVPRAPVVERPNRSMDSYVRKQEPKQQNQPAPLAQGQAKQGVKRRAQPLHPKGGSSARRARSSAPVTPAASPEAADLRPQTANPFVETQVPAPVPAAKQAAAEAKSRFFAARPAPAAPAAAPAPALAPASASSSAKPPLFVPESPLQSEMPPPQAEPRAREAEQTNLFSNYRHNDPQAPVSATSATSATAKHRPTERGRKSGQGAATASKPSSSCPACRGRHRAHTCGKQLERKASSSSSVGGAASDSRRADHSKALLDRWGYKPPTAADAQSGQPNESDSSGAETGAEADDEGDGRARRRQKPPLASAPPPTLEQFGYQGGRRVADFPLAKQAPVPNRGRQSQPQPRLSLGAQTDDIEDTAPAPRRRWPGSGLDDEDEDEIEEETDTVRARKGGGRFGFFGTGARRRSSVLEDSIETSDDEARPRANLLSTNPFQRFGRARERSPEFE